MALERRAAGEKAHPFRRDFFHVLLDFLILCIGGQQAHGPAGKVDLDLGVQGRRGGGVDEWRPKQLGLVERRQPEQDRESLLAQSSISASGSALRRSAA